MVMRHEEQAFHIAVAQYLDVALPPEYPWTTIGHGGGGKTRGSILKAMGVKPGWPDIIILAPSISWGSSSSRFIGLELKAERGKLSPAQKDVHERILFVGGFVHICRTLAEVEGALRAEMIPLRAKMSA